MLAVLSCLHQQHDLRLVLVAAAICLVSILTAFNLYARALRTDGALRYCWVGLAGFIAGSGVWATHFIAMLAYQPDLLIGYDLVGTVASLLISVAGLSIAFAIPAAWPRPAIFAPAGAVAGLGVGAMHFTGMTAVSMPA